MLSSEKEGGWEAGMVLLPVLSKGSSEAVRYKIASHVQLGVSLEFRWRPAQILLTGKSQEVKECFS